MAFLQPMLLLGLPAILIPVIVHLLNRMRYRTVPWAALMFLMQATSSSTRNARLRQYLVLACRVLTLLGLLLALARPVVGGRLGLTLAAPPETVILLLDRSLSMETTDPRHQRSHRARALDLLREAAQPLGTRSRFVLIENVLRQPRALASLDALADLDLTAPTDTGADIPAMLQAALDYAIDQNTGRTELWLVSDMQQSNWRPESPAWQRLAATCAAMPASIRLRVVPLEASTAPNARLALRDRREAGTADQRRLHLAFDIGKDNNRSETLPLALAVNDALTQDNVTMAADALRWHRTLAVADGPGWGYATLPADANPRDNLAFFTYGGQSRASALILSDSPATARFLAAAASAAPGQPPPTILTPSAAPPTLAPHALLIWQAGQKPTDNATTALDTFMRAGGVILLLPPADDQSTQSPVGDLAWGPLETFADDSPMTVTLWEHREGPLANTADGRTLPLADTTLRRRRLPKPTSGDAAAQLDILARCRDGEPLLLRRKVGDGALYAASTLPHPDWSNLADGLILVPLTQRLLQEGANRLSHTPLRTVGEWQPDPAPTEWTALRPTPGADPRWTAGVYRHANTLIALNPPPYELETTTIAATTPPSLLGETYVQMLDDIGARDNRALHSELWPFFLSLAFAAMLAEMLLLLGPRPPAAAAAPNLRPGEVRHA